MTSDDIGTPLGDPFELYRLLGLTPSATMEEVEATDCRRPYYIPSGDESDKVFAEAYRRTPEAHALLTDPARRASYDWFARNLPDEAIEPDGSIRYDLGLIPDGPLHCLRCGRVALQPRYVTLWYIEEVDGHPQAVGREDFLCVDCARDGRRFNSFGEFVSGVLDLFIRPNSLDRNRFRHSVVGLFKVGMGEKHDRITDARLILHNVRAFLEQGDIRTAYGLAKLIRKSEDEGIASEAAQIIRIIDASGADTSGWTIKDDWALSEEGKQLYRVMGFIVPAAIIVTLYVYNGQEAASGHLMLSGVPVEGCSRPPEQTGVLTPQTAAHGDLTLRIRNTAWQDAVVKVRDRNSAVVASIFLKRNDSFDIPNLPRGDYKIQFELGFTFDRSCTAFASPWHVGERSVSSKTVISPFSSGQEIIEYELGAATRRLSRTELGRVLSHPLLPRVPTTPA